MAVKKRHCIHNKNKWFPVDELPLMFQVKQEQCAIVQSQPVANLSAI